VIGHAPAAPWHFKALIFATVIYLAWRGIQGIEWVVHRLS
jgi:hypothetical protein